MTIDEARNYLYSNGMSDEQMRTVERGFVCGILQEIRQEIEDIPFTMLSTSHEYERGVNSTINRATFVIDNYVKKRYTE